ncbi:TPA: DUF2213 domain-containing protein [Escherichia coli]|uniref:DUF2213 domain-containing protein n=1 Tax=Escherichia coli O141:H4 TaxID=2861806 RepID=A0ABD7FAH6_ECOLX|nr:DUF2213 domain-containing protein [Escherichia coli]EFN7859078.1 DUF2213 domain-containing protein [Escherichia coli]EFN9854876.1 DUF2213 domain-containing protein [Escherichia coli]MBB9758548.1 DUF2213 domain-containing protein [Escherichia coli]QYE37416.1 DUF2213 domain-containing protein [Escherichia coli O141:H4]RJX84290.1 DUF2213 domain-containing protein [Escherichia coli]
MSLTELEVAERIRDGTVPSPVKFSNMWLVNLRITGTGLAYRAGLKEHVWRDPKLYLNEEFLRRCNGLPVIANHPDDAVLTEEDFKSRIVGSVMLPYIRGDEVWAVCRVYLQSIVEEITEGDVSTSPSVVFNSTSGNVEVQEGDTNFLIEGVPFLVDHIALVTKAHGSLGVWDKDRIPAGVEVTNTGEIEMEKEELQALLQGVVNDALSGINQKIDGVVTRMDSLEQRDKARADAEEQAKKEAEEKAKADEAAEEQRKADEAAAKEAEEQRKADEEAEKERNDSALAEAQAKADSAFSACGKNAPAPFSGENVLDYRKRALIAMQKHSPAHKDVNIRAIADSATLAVLEDAIFSAARQSIEKEMMSTQGQLHKRIRNDEAGRRITEYQGDPNVWLSAFKIPGRRLAKINTQGSLNNG